MCLAFVVTVSDSFSVCPVLILSLELSMAFFCTPTMLGVLNWALEEDFGGEVNPCPRTAGKPGREKERT